MIAALAEFACGAIMIHFALNETRTWRRRVNALGAGVCFGWGVEFFVRAL